jgi:hypothetical protein
MNCFRFTGHPFVDAGIAGMAAILEQEAGNRFNSPEELSETDAQQAIELAGDLYYYRRVRKDAKASDKPLLYFQLQEVLPGSPWDQVKTGNVADSMEAKFRAHVSELKEAAKRPAIGRCFLTGHDAHIMASKIGVPMLSSVAERPNCYPNLANGLPINAWVGLAVLLSPFSIEKTVNDNTKGGQCFIYHSPNWRFMVAVAERNLNRLRVLLAAACIEDFRKAYYAKFRRGTWKLALSTTLHAVNRIPESDIPRVVVWSFNASNQSSRYDNVELSDSFTVLHQNRLLFPTAYRDIPRCSDEVSRLILEGQPIARKSINIKQYNNSMNGVLRPGWTLQRLYAEKVLKMPITLLGTIEGAAQQLGQDSRAVTYCLFEQRLRIERLAKEFKLSAEACAVFADSPDLWADYLRAAVLWASNGNVFTHRVAVTTEAGPAERLIKNVAGRLRAKHNYKHLAMMLSIRSLREYRTRWIRLLKDGACTWDDFLAFNPLDEALSIGGNYHTRVLRDYLVAYLFASAGSATEEDLVGEETITTYAEDNEAMAFDDAEETEET